MAQECIFLPALWILFFISICFVVESGASIPVCFAAFGGHGPVFFRPHSDRRENRLIFFNPFAHRHGVPASRFLTLVILSPASEPEVRAGNNGNKKSFSRSP